MHIIKEDASGFIIKVVVQPRAAKTGVVGRHDDALKIRITAPPVDGAANKMCVQHLAKRLKVSPSSIEILSGHTSRTKQLRIRYHQNKNVQKEKTRLRKVIQSLLDGKVS